MLAVFKPVHNTIGFELREVTLKQGKLFTKAVSVNMDTNGLPVFKPKSACNNKKEFYNQFNSYISQLTE